MESIVGGVLVSHHNDHIGKWLKKGVFYEAGMLAFISGLNLNGTYIDVGANVGNHSIYFTKYCHATSVIAFEPHPDNFKYLKINGTPLKNFSAINKALGSMPGSAFITTDADNMGMCKLSNQGHHVEVVTMDSYALKNVTLIKIDVEGDYMDVLVGAIDTIRRCNPELFIEGDKEELLSFLEPMGYDYVRSFNHTPTHYFSANATELKPSL